MRESPFYQELVAEGEQVGTRKDILQALTIRFGAEVAKEHEQAINRLENLEQLEELHKIAIKSRRASQFRRALAEL
jgi:hypothetical protein